MSWNTPDDWNTYYSNCARCGARVHASEGGCPCREDLIPCDEKRCGNYCSEEDNTVLGGRNLCPDHARCECCDRLHADAPLTYLATHDLLCCKLCEAEDHNCDEVADHDHARYREPTYQDYEESF